MRNTDKRTEKLCDDFGSEEAAAEFWDTHSITDYEDLLEPVNVRVDIKRRHFEIEVDEECFKAVRDTARRQHRPVKQLASEIIKRQLASP
jgi:hypothetical protein